MEHLVSHMLDMYAAGHHFEVGLHGKQVGVASVVAAVTWEYLIDQIRAGRKIELRNSTAGLEQTVASVFVVCDETGALGAECWNDYSAKLTKLDSAGEKITELLSSAEKIEIGLGKTLPNSENLLRGLHLAGAAYSPTQLDDWVTADVWKWAVRNAHLMRNRVTIIDLLDAAGWWKSNDVDEVFRRVETLISEVENV